MYTEPPLPHPPPSAVLARDPQSVVFYDSKGKFVGVRRPGSKKPIVVSAAAFVLHRCQGRAGYWEVGSPWW